MRVSRSVSTTTTALLLSLSAVFATNACAPTVYEDTSGALAEAPRALAAPRLGFTSIIDARTLGEEPDPLIAGTSLYEIVSSRVTVRTDGKGCSDCHYAGAEAPYRPAITQGSDRAISPSEIVDGRTFGGADGWAARFIAHDEAHASSPESVKPLALRRALQKWLDDGAWMRGGIEWNRPLTFEALGGEPDPLLAGLSLKDIVSSRVSARADGKLCATCHRVGGEVAYQPPLEDDPGDVILAGSVVDGRTWRGDNGWAWRFVGTNEGPDAKPPALRALFALWLEDGGL